MVGVASAAYRPVRQSTFYFSCNPPHPNNFIASDSRPADNIWIGWHAHHMNHNGFLRWAYDYWLESNPFEMRTGGHTSGDFSLCYRSSNSMDMKVYSSVRLELIREGIQDFEKILLLRRRFENSERAEDQHKLTLLNNKIDEFTFASGKSISVTELVKGAQKLLKDIVTLNTTTNNFPSTVREFDFKIFPNPIINDHLHVSFTNYHGQANISVCSAGVYIVRISSASNELCRNQKFIITR
jgi:hypothetical protein